MDKHASAHALFQLVGGHPVLDYVNTLDWRFRSSGAEELLSEYGDLLQLVTQSRLLHQRVIQDLPRISGPKATTLLSNAKLLPETIAGLLYARLDGVRDLSSTIHRLVPFLKASHRARKLINGEVCLTWDWKAASATSELPILLLAQSAEQLLTSALLAHVRACCNPECRWLFLDTSKNHSRRWCDMKSCGNRMKARRFRSAQPVSSAMS